VRLLDGVPSMAFGFRPERLGELEGLIFDMC
jgi:hypothetical protein